VLSLSFGGRDGLGGKKRRCEIGHHETLVRRGTTEAA
jgi:hypothetical protein